MRDHVEEYLGEQSLAWAKSTFDSEASRLRSVSSQLHLDPPQLYLALVSQGRKPYAIKTLFVRLASMERWCIEKGYIKNVRYGKYLKRHKNKFKFAYQKEELEITYDEARGRILKLEEPYQAMALGLLETGLRISEAYKVIEGKVIGKGGKPRKVFGEIKSLAPRSTFSRKLAEIGLKPHTLRKLCATRLAERGATPADLCKAMGWSTIVTAYHYLQGKDDERLQALMETKEEG